MVFNRHDYINQMNQYWNNTNPSNVGVGMFKRNDDFTITKTFGRTDLALINHTDDNQYVFELTGFSRPNSVPKEVKEQMYSILVNNMESVLRSLHFQNWLSNQTIKNMPFQETIDLLQKGLDSFDYAEALSLFPR